MWLPKPSLVLWESPVALLGRKGPAPLRLLHPQTPSHCDKDLKGANEIISSAFYSSVTTTKLDEMTPCSSNLRPILLPSTPILSLLNGYETLKTCRPVGLVIVGFFLQAGSRPVPQRALLLPPGRGHNQFNLHASETSL